MERYTYQGVGQRSSGSGSIINEAIKFPNPGLLFSMLKKSSRSATTLASMEWIRFLPSIACFCTRFTKSSRRIVAYWSRSLFHLPVLWLSGASARGRTRERTATSTRPVVRPSAVRGLFNWSTGKFDVR